MNCPNCSTIDCPVPLINHPNNPPGIIQCPFCTFNVTFNVGENQRKMDEFFVWLSIDKKTGLENIMGFNIGGVEMSGISSQRKAVEHLRDKIKEVRGTMPDYDFRLVRFSRAEILEDIL